jgi:hypothetical protein
MNTPNRDDFVTPQNNPTGVSAHFLKELLDISNNTLYLNITYSSAKKPG